MTTINLYRFIIVSLIVSALYLQGCTKKEDIRISYSKPEKSINDFFGNNSSLNRPPIINLYSDTVYTVSNTFTREAGEVLNIEAGTLIKVKSEGAVVEIIIKPGAKMMAEGSAEKPIVFTSNKRAGSQIYNWGGIKIQGNAFRNDINNPGANTNDNSGILKYVRVEFAPLFFEAVGNTTIADHIMVSYANKTEQGSPVPAFNIIGGSFNAKHLLSYACGAWADFYITRGYSGKLQHLIGYRHPYYGSFNTAALNALCGIYIENHPNATTANTAIPQTAPIISNLTIIGPSFQNGTIPAYADTSLNTSVAALIATKNTLFNIRNSIFSSYPASAWHLSDPKTAVSFQLGVAPLDYSVFQSNYPNRTFYLKSGVFPPYTSSDFKIFATTGIYSNLLYNSFEQLQLNDPYNYAAPDLLPKEGSPILTGAKFDQAPFNHVFFNNVSYIGALGVENWLLNWTNFNPLKTNYNFPE